MKNYPIELIEFIDSIKDLKCLAVVKNKNTKYYQNYKILKHHTSFLNGDTLTSHRIWYVINNIFSCVICPNCGISTGLSKKMSPKFCSVKCSKLYINPKSNISAASIASKKGANTKRNTLINGKSQQEIINLKIKNSFDVTTKKNLKDKISKTLNTIQDSGMTLAQESGIKCSITKNKVNPKTGMTLAQESGLKTKQSLKIKSYQNLIYTLDDIDVTLISNFDDWLNTTFITYQCNKCNSIRNSSYSYIRCITCYPYNKSIAENEILEYCKSLTSNIISNSRSIIAPLELDIHIPDHNLAIEYNGLFWHSSYSTYSENKNYHLYKTQECEKQGIQLFHIFENEWQDPKKQAIWKSIIKNKLGQSKRIFARKTEIRSVTFKDKTKFLIYNHLQGDCNSSVNLGLYLGDELVSLMTFGKSRYDKKVDWELLRFCNKIGYSVVGGASKLLKLFRKENSGSIISYADKRRSNGNLYNQLGFEFSHESKPNYFYFKNNDKSVIFHRSKFMKHKLENQLRIFNPSITESENMYNNGYRKIYDCGNQVWILNYLKTVN